MPRTGRVVLPEYPHHIVQRGHNRQVVFAEPEDFQRYLDTLVEFKDQYGVSVYGYCLMTNHVHLLVAPQDVSGLGALMKRLAGRQTRYHNQLEGRRGTLWESRYKSSPVDTDEYLLACLRYIEMNPVRAAMVEKPEQYPWSSCRAHLGLQSCPWLDAMPLSLYTDAHADWIDRYRAYLQATVAASEWASIREAVARGQLTGTNRFVDEVERILGRRIEKRGPGRPRVGEEWGDYGVVG
ncbi:MAG: transposase [Permianibacter sp.]